MRYPLFPMHVGEKFISVPEDLYFEFLGAHESESRTLMFDWDGMATVGVSLQSFMDAYCAGLIKEVPGAGNVREVA